MAFEMVNADHRFSKRVPKRARNPRTDQQRPRESRPLRVRDAVEIGEREAGFCKRSLGQRDNALHMIARRELRHDTAVRLVHGHLRVQRVGNETALGVVNGDAGLIAGSLKAEDAHGGMRIEKVPTGSSSLPALPRRNPIVIMLGFTLPQVLKGKRSMPSVRVRENEPFEAALRRFKRTIEKTGLLTELRAREFYEKPTSERKRKKAAAIKRHYKRLRSQQLPPKLY